MSGMNVEPGYQLRCSHRENIQCATSLLVVKIYVSLIFDYNFDTMLNPKLKDVLFKVMK